MNQDKDTCICCWHGILAPFGSCHENWLLALVEVRLKIRFGMRGSTAGRCGSVLALLGNNIKVWIKVTVEG